VAEVKVSFTDDSDGQATIEIDGVVGPSCKDVALSVAKLLGSKVVKEDPKDDFYAQNTAGASQTEGS
jgi:hypothetical protein